MTASSKSKTRRAAARRSAASCQSGKSLRCKITASNCSRPTELDRTEERASDQPLAGERTTRFKESRFERTNAVPAADVIGLFDQGE